LGRLNLRILSVSGEVVQTKTIDFSTGNQITIPLNDLQNGVYFIEFAKEGVSMQRMIVKQ
jgi:hypothetical protein